MTQSVRIISGKTMVPLGLFGVLMGGVTWLTSLHFNTTATAARAEKIEARLDETEITVATKLDAVSDRLSKMEGQLSIIYDLLREKKR